jgi:hypothetical protein
MSELSKSINKKIKEYANNSYNFVDGDYNFDGENEVYTEEFDSTTAYLSLRDFTASIIKLLREDNK